MPEKEFQIKQVLFSLDSDNFKIKCDGEDVYQVKGNGFKYGSQASFQTMDGTELAFLRQTNADEKLEPWKKFEWVKDGKVWAHARTNQSYWGFLDKKRIEVNIPGENDYTLTGNRVAWKFEVFKGDDKVGDIKKKLDFKYTVVVADGANEVDVLLCGILIDHLYHNNSNPINREPAEFDKKWDEAERRRSKPRDSLNTTSPKRDSHQSKRDSHSPKRESYQSRRDSRQK